MNVVICKNYDEVSRVGAFIIAEQIRMKPKSVLGFATGSTPEGIYANLTGMCKRGGLDFSEVVTFNLDEYYPMKKTNAQSYDYFMWDKLFSHVNIKRENVHLPNGEAVDPTAECEAYDKMIAAAGGLDLQLLGMGVNGHIGFNEPDAELILGTHLTDLTPSTIEVNSRFFASAAEVPTQALTMGMGTIMNARSILLVITGEAKAESVKRALSGKVSTGLPASFLNMHPNVTLLLDEAAAGKI